MSSKDFVPFEERPKAKGHEASHQSQGHGQDMAFLHRDLGPYVTAQGRPIPPVSMSKKGMQMQVAWKQQDAECSRDPDDTITFPTRQLKQIMAAEGKDPTAPQAIPKQQSKGSQPQQGKQIAQSLPKNSPYIPGPSDIHQQVITRAPMQNITELEVAAIQQQYGFQNAAFAQRLVAARYTVHNLYVAWYVEAQKSGDKVGAARKVGYDTTDPGRFSSTTPLDNPHLTGQGGYVYNTTLTAEADAYYRRIWAQELRQWNTEVEKKQEQNRQAQAAAQQHQQQLTRQQQEQAYLSWGQSMNKSPQQRHDLAVLKQKISQAPKTAGAEDTPFVSLERSVNQQMSALMGLTGEPVSDAVVQGIRNKLLFERYGEAKEIAIVGQTLPQAERKGLDTLFNKLEPSHEKKVSGDTDALYRRITGKEPERGDLTWTVCRNRLLREYYAGAGEPKVAQQQSGSSTRIQATAGLPAKITGDLTIHGGQPTSDNRQSVGAVSGGAVQQGSLEPETPVGHFQRELQKNAHSALESNRERLNQQQRQYQDPNPKSPYWQALWKAKRTHDGLETRIRVLEAQAAKSAEDLNNQSDLPSLKSPEEQRNSPRQKELEGLAAQKAAQRQELALLKGYKLQTEYEFPALSAMGSEKANTRENNAQISGRIPEKFDEIRGSISDLEGQIQNDPKVALRLDKVVEKILKDGGDSVEVREWLASEQFWKGVGTAAGAIGTGAAVVAMLLNPEVGILRWIAAGLGIGTAAAQLPDAIIEDRAAQSGRGGAQQVTSLDPDTARGNLTLAWVSLGVAGLDAGLQPEVVAQVVRLPGVARAAMSMTKAQGKVLVERLAQVKGEVSEAMVQRMAQGLRRGDPEAGAIFPETDMKQQLLKRQRENALKTFEAYENASEVRAFIGTKVDPNNLPEGYLYGKIPTGKDGAGNEIYREVVYMPKPKNTTVPLVVEKGTIQMGKEGEYRIVEKAVYDKNVVTDPTKSGKLLGGDSQIHHLFADNMLRNTPFGQRALRLGAVNPDGSINLIELASSKSNLVDARKAYPDVKLSDFIHNTQHPLFDGLMQQVVNDQIDLVREAKGFSGKNKDFIPQMTKEDIQEVWNEALTKMKAGLMGEDKALYIEIEKRTRSGKKSLAQGESPDGIEVA
jgi:hypothetical protein